MSGSPEPILAWHFLGNDRRLRFGERELVEAGKTYAAKGRLVMCSNGMHASERALDALRYAPGSTICRVRLSGQVLRDSDKLCARKREVLWMADATTVLHEFSAWAAEWILDRLESKGYKIDPRSRAAVEAKRKWLRGEIDDKALDAAWVAAGADKALDAAWAAAGVAAGAAARAAAWDAASAAAGAAAGAAAYAAAWDAARDAAYADLNIKFTEMLMALEPTPESSR